MTANRAAPTLSNTPGGIEGDDYAARIAEEITALYLGRVNQVTSVGGSANAITGVCTPPLTAAPQHGETFRLTPASNNTTAVTVNLDSTGAKDLRNESDGALTADDLVSGRPITFWYDSGTGRYRLVQPTLKAILAAVSSEISSSNQWEVIGSTVISTAVANVEHLFTANRYSEIRVIVGGISASAGSNTLNIDLRYASGSILLLVAGGGSIGANDFCTHLASLIIDTNSATKVHYGVLRGTRATSVMAPYELAASSANVPDRIRLSFNSGNIDAGHIQIIGLKK